MSSILANILGHGSPAPGGHGLPPDISAAVQGAGGGGEDSSSHEQDEVQLLTKILDDIHTFMKVAADEDDKAVMATCLANIQKLRAKDQQEMDGAMQGKTSPRMVRKAAAAQGGAGGGY